MEIITQQIKIFLSSSPSQGQLSEFLQSFKVSDKVKPTKILHEINLNQQHTPIILYTRLMVQDIRDSQYYYPLFIKKPINQKSEFILCKYGGDNFNPQNYEKVMHMIKSNQYAKSLSNRDVIICSSVKYQTDWLKKLKNQKQTNYVDSITVLFDKKAQVKLGEIFNAICYWDPQTQSLYFLNNVSDQQARDVNLDPWNRIIHNSINSKQLLKYNEIKQKIIALFASFSSQRYAHLLLYSLISKQSYFLSGQNIEQLMKQLAPRVFRMKIKAPFKQPLFPYKDQDGKLVNTSMQMSQQSTFVILDFSEMSSSNEVKIQQQQIDNLKALKVFVEESKTVYRWEMGESLVGHNHVGLVVKGSNIVVPHFHLKDEKIIAKNNLLDNVSEEDKMKMRVYIQMAKKLNSVLDQIERGKIQISLKQQNEIPKDQYNLIEIMRIAKLNAMSQGRQIITNNDYMKARKLLFAEFLQKEQKQ